MPDATVYLVVIDLPGIKEFVFGTSRLVEIRGASGLLDRLNRVEIPELFRERLGEAKVDCVFAGGGAGQFILTADREAIASALHAAHGLVCEKSGGGLRLIWGLAPLAGENEYSDALRIAYLDQDRRKNHFPFPPTSTLHSGFLRECDSCAAIASRHSFFGETHRMLCETCWKKENFGRERGLWNDFFQFMRKANIEGKSGNELRPRDFGEIGERSKRKGYTALVYADGNSMGRIVRAIQSSQEFADFSRSVDTAIREACFEAISRCCPIAEGKIPADILLLGGDDLLVYLSAETAFPFALEAARRFREKTRENLVASESAAAFRPWIEAGGMTISLGIAFGKSHTPIAILLEQAEELLSLAKRKGLENKGDTTVAPAHLDFHLSTRFNQISVSESRRMHLTLKTPAGEKLQLRQGPYTLTDARDLWAYAQELAASDIPRSRLHRLGMAPFRGKADGSVETLIQIGRTRKGEQRKAICGALKRFDCLETMPWRNTDEGAETALVELIELSEFARG